MNITRAQARVLRVACKDGVFTVPSWGNATCQVLTMAGHLTKEGRDYFPTDKARAWVEANPVPIPTRDQPDYAAKNSAARRARNKQRMAFLKEN